MNRLLTVPEVAKILRIKVSTLYTWVRLGKVPCTRIGRLIRFTGEQLNEILG